MRRHFFQITLCMAVLALLSACYPGRTTVAPMGGGQTTVPVQTYQTQTMADRAAEAWARGDMMEAERFYNLTLRDPSTPASVRPLAWERLAASAVANNHIHSALEVLETWRADVPGADTSPAWLQIWERAIDQLPVEDVARRTEAVWRDTLRPGPVRFAAAKRALVTGNPELGEVLASAYSQSDQNARAAMERDLLSALASLPEPTVHMLAGVPPGPDTQFPWSIYLLETARRHALVSGRLVGEEPDPLSPLSQLMARLALVQFADPGLIGVVTQPGMPGGHAEPALPLPSVQELVAERVSFHPVCTALLLPLSGPYASIGQSVQAGATTAQAQMQQAGVHIDVQFIDTNNPGWTQQLAYLPAQCVTVGGPLQGDAYATAKAQGALHRRALFAFMGRIDDGDEGTAAWRFFPSRDDQIMTMLRFAQQMGIHQYGVLYPDDTYGQAMSGEFASLASRSGGSVTSMTSYPVGSPGEWTKVAGNFVGVRVVNKVPVPSSSFRAVFLPDSWNNMDMLISSLFYQGEDSQLLMGTSLWEQTLLENPPAVLNNMNLVVFPGMWNKRSLSVPARLMQAGLAGRRADTWSAMGYDFVRFASAMNLSSPASPRDVNARIEQAQNMNWSMAPIRWSGGRAAQDLFVLAPTMDAPVLVEPTVFKQQLDAARGRSERRASRALGKP